MKKILCLIAFLLTALTPSSFAVMSADQIYEYNHFMGPIPFKYSLGTLLHNFETVSSGTLLDGQFWVGNGSNVATGVTPSGAFTLSNLGVATLATAGVTYAKFQDVAGLSIVGRSANTSGVSAAITGTDGQLLRVSGTALGFGTVVAAGIASDAVTTVKILDANVTYAKIANGAGTSIIGKAATGAGVNADITGTDGQALRVSGTTVGFGTIAAAGIAAGAVSETKLAVPTADGLNARRIARATYDVAVNLGTIGAHTLGVTLPAKAIITRSWFYTVTQFVDAGAGTVALHCETANNIYSAADITGNAIAAIVEGVSTGAASVFKPITAACNLTATVATADQSAGKLILFVEYSVAE